MKQHKHMTSHLPGVRSPAGSSWVCSSASHEAEIQTWGLKQGPLPSHSPATMWPCLSEEETTTIRLCPETVLDTVPAPDLFTPRSRPGLEGDSRTKAAPQRHLSSRPRQRLQWSGCGGGRGAGPGAPREVGKPSPCSTLHHPIRPHLLLNIQIFLTTSDLTRLSKVVMGVWTLVSLSL